MGICIFFRNIRFSSLLTFCILFYFIYFFLVWMLLIEFSSSSVLSDMKWEIKLSLKVQFDLEIYLVFFYSKFFFFIFVYYILYLIFLSYTLSTLCSYLSLKEERIRLHLPILDWIVSSTGPTHLVILHPFFFFFTIRTHPVFFLGSFYFEQ